MTKQEKARWLAEIYAAVADGKTLQYFNDGKWVEIFDPGPSMYSYQSQWRIKPEPKEIVRVVGGSFDLRTVVLPANWDIGTSVRVVEVLEDE